MRYAMRKLCEGITILCVWLLGVWVIVSIAGIVDLMHGRTYPLLGQNVALSLFEWIAGAVVLLYIIYKCADAMPLFAKQSTSYECGERISRTYNELAVLQDMLNLSIKLKSYAGDWEA